MARAVLLGQYSWILNLSREDEYADPH